MSPSLLLQNPRLQQATSDQVHAILSEFRLLRGRFRIESLTKRPTPGVRTSHAESRKTQHVELIYEKYEENTITLPDTLRWTMRCPFKIQPCSVGGGKLKSIRGSPCREVEW